MRGQGGPAPAAALWLIARRSAVLADDGGAALAVTRRAAGGGPRLSHRLAALAAALAAALVLATAATAAAQQADPSTVALTRTLNLGPFSSCCVTGGTAYVRLTAVKGTVPKVVVVDSGQGNEAKVAVTVEQAAGLPRGTLQIRLTPPPGMNSGGYTGQLLIGDSSPLTVKVLVQHMIIWPILAVLLGALIGLLARYVGRRAGWLQQMFGVDEDPGHGANGRVVFGAAAIIATVTYCGGVYSGHTFGQWTQYVAAIAVGASGHLIGHAANRAAPKRPQHDGQPAS